MNLTILPKPFADSMRQPNLTGAGLAVVLAVGLAGCSGEFDLDVGAFEIGQTEAILWTHVVPDDPDSKAAKLMVVVATDPGFDDVVSIRPAFALANNDFTVRSRVKHLDPGTNYYYKFKTHTSESSVGSFKTVPEVDDTSPVRFVISGDSNQGYMDREGYNFYVLSAAAADDPDFFVYFGDTIYADSGVLETGDAETLDEYREVHKRTRADDHLQTLIASTGTYTGWDDHEVRNDYDGETVDPDQFANGARAFFEYLPLRLFPSVGPYVTNRTIRWGQHVELFFIDGRQYRTAEMFCNETSPDGPPAADTLFSPFVEDEVIAVGLDPVLGSLAAALLLTPSDPVCASTLLTDPSRSLLGTEQLAWLKAALQDSDATYKIIINDVPISSILVTPYDRWEGYLAERQDLLDFIAANLDPDRVLVLSTDFHTNMAIRREELTEVIVGPIGQTTFATAVQGLIPPELASFIGLVLNLFDGVVDVANGPPQTPPIAPTGTVLASEHNAFSYAVVDVFEGEFGDPKLRVTVRGDTSYALGANDPSLVQDLFTIELP
jgi:phosphodiesterase/alkaline phosphatase D-like protein